MARSHGLRRSVPTWAVVMAWCVCCALLELRRGTNLRPPPPLLLGVAVRALSSSSSPTPSAPSPTPHTAKSVVFLRHGCTYMNEYLGRGVAFGEPGFTDIFDTATEQRYYRDTPLSPLGQRQVQALAASSPSFLNDCELIVTSPLTRALQTLHHGLWPVLSSSRQQQQQQQQHQSWSRRKSIPSIVATPLAAERLYLISDVGRPVHELSWEFPYVDFVTCFEKHHGDETPTKKEDDDDGRHTWWYTPPPSLEDEVQEWRPTGQGQRYACQGEPIEAFDARMHRLSTFLWERPEQHIAVVCHWGVAQWMLGGGENAHLDNCEWRRISLPLRRQPSEPQSPSQPHHRALSSS